MRGQIAEQERFAVAVRPDPCRHLARAEADPIVRLRPWHRVAVKSVLLLDLHPGAILEILIVGRADQRRVLGAGKRLHVNVTHLACSAAKLQDGRHYSCSGGGSISAMFDEWASA